MYSQNRTHTNESSNQGRRPTGNLPPGAMNDYENYDKYPGYGPEYPNYFNPNDHPQPIPNKNNGGLQLPLFNNSPKHMQIP